MSATAVPAPLPAEKTAKISFGINRLVVVVLLSTLGVGTASWLALATLAPDAGTSSWLWARATAGAATLLSAAALLLCRAQASRQDRELWRPLATASCVVAAGFIAQTILVRLGDANATSGASLQTLPFAIATLATAPLIYSALVQWNRSRMALTNGTDWLNGLTAVLAMAALGNLVIRGTGWSVAQWPWWELQGWVVGLACGVVLLGTAMTVAMLGRSLGDARPWLIAAALTVVMGTQLTSFGAHSLVAYGGWPQTGWLLAFAVFAWLSIWRTTTTRPEETTTTMSSAIGMMVILAASVLTLAVDNELGNAPGSHVTTLYAILAIAGSSVQSVRIIRDLSQLAQTRQEARTDELTGTANRRALLARLEAAVSRPGGVCLLLIDLNRFKDVNDQHGHAIGDGLLRAVSRRLERLMPTNGLLARLGGDEFAVLLETEKAQDATILALALLDAISMVVEVDGRRLSIGASIGIAACRTDADPPFEGIRGGELLRRADVAMYVAKGSGSGVSVYHAAVDAAILERLTRLDELSVILSDTATPEQRSELVVYYQAQLDTDSRRIVGAEALIRWQHPRLGLIGPDAFLDLIEDNGLMGRLTAHVLHEACAQAVRWRAMGNPLRIAVNLSTSSLTDPDLLPLIDRAIATSGLNPGALTLEITETTLMADPEWCLETTRLIASRGIGVSIDDYGTGYSSLAYLSDLPATELKLDRSLTARVATDKRTAAVVAGTVELAHRLDLRLVAEGVEDEATLTALRALNCDEVQGYLFGKPGPAHLLDAKLALPTPRRPLALVQGAHLVPPLTGRSVS